VKKTIQAIMQAAAKDRPLLIAAQGKQRADDAKANIERKLEEDRPQILFNAALQLCDQLRETWLASGVGPIDALAIAWVVVAANRLKTLPKTWAGAGAQISNYFTRDNPPLPPMEWISALGGAAAAESVNNAAAALWQGVYAGYTRALS